jgi:hypothetical protein
MENPQKTSRPTVHRRARTKDFAVRAAVLVAIAAGIALQSHHDRVRRAARADREARLLATPGPPTSAHPILRSRDYVVGDCVTWDQVLNPLGEWEATSVVPCSRPHLFEVAGHVDLSAGGDYPTDDGWRDMAHTGECLRLDEKLLTHPFDSHGRFILTVIRPTAGSWSMGRRKVWCGISARKETDHDDEDQPWKLVPLTGSARGQDQTRLNPVGTCLPRDPSTGKTRPPVPCGDPHSYEITGVVDIADRTAERPATTEEWARAVSTDCRRLAQSYLGRAPDNRFRSVWFEIPVDSWAAGRRVAECGLAVYGPDGDRSAISGEARSQ